MRWIGRLLREDEAATAVEYAVILALILMSVVGAIGVVGNQAGGMWSNNVDEMRNVGFVP